MDVWQEIGQDPLFIEYSRLAQEKNLPEPSSMAHTGKVLAKFGRYTMYSHIFSDCILHAIYDSPKTCWQLIVFFKRNIHGIGRNRQGKPKLYMKYKVREIIRKARISGVGSFYQAIKILEDKKIIFFREGNLYLNIFPLIWNLEKEEDRECVREIVEREIEKLRGEDENNGTESD